MRDGGYSESPGGTSKRDTRKLARTKTPGIFTRGDDYVVVYRDPNGRQCKRVVPTLAAARAVKATVTADVHRGEYRETSRVTFAEYAADWLVSYRGRTSRGIREETLAEYRRQIERRAIPFFGKLRLSAIEPRDVKRYVATVESERSPKGKPLSADSVRLALAPVKALFATAVEEGAIRWNPAAGVRVARPSGLDEDGEERKAKALTPVELEALLDAVDSEHALVVGFLAATGFRISEALGLRWQDVDLAGRRVSVRRRRYKGSVDTPKSRHGRRDVRISAAMAERLGGLWREDRSGEGFVFPVNASTVYRAVKTAAEVAGVPWVSPHTLRHTAASLLFARGENPKAIQRWLGHHRASFTLDTYVHLLDDELPDAIEISAGESPSGTERRLTSVAY